MGGFFITCAAALLVINSNEVKMLLYICTF